jgi:hypothetical protein
VVGGFEDRYFLSFVHVLLFVDVNTLFQRGYFYVGLWGAEWYFLPENPTFFVRRNRKIPHTQIHIVSTEPSLHHPTHSGFAVTLQGNIRHGPKSWRHRSL